MIIQFLKTYWKEIAAITIFIFQIVILLTKKKPVKVIDTFMTQMYQVCLNGIKAVEDKVGSGHGASKKEMVIELVCKAFNEIYGPSINIDAIKDVASAVIEELLSTPQKKGD